MAIPTRAIGWSHNYRELLEMFELGYPWTRFEELEAQCGEMQAELDTDDLEVCERFLQRADLIAERVRERAVARS